MIDFETHFKDFFAEVSSGKIEIYNEFSLQHELGLYLRSLLNANYKVQFERPVSYFGLVRHGFEKKEIDIAIYSIDLLERYAVELKYPRNGQHPEQMFKACQDICFVEQLALAGFTRCYFVMVADDPNFYFSKKSSDGIYRYFRQQHPINGVIEKPTGVRDHAFEIKGQYSLIWNNLNVPTKFAIVSVGG